MGPVQIASGQAPGSANSQNFKRCIVTQPLTSQAGAAGGRWEAGSPQSHHITKHSLFTGAAEEWAGAQLGEGEAGEGGFLKPSCPMGKSSRFPGQSELQREQVLVAGSRGVRLLVHSFLHSVIL